MQEVASFIWIQAVSAAGTYRKRSAFLVIHKKAPDARASGAFWFLSVGFFFWQRALSFRHRVHVPDTRSVPTSCRQS